MVSTNPFAQRLARKGSSFSGRKISATSLIFGLLISFIALIDAASSAEPAPRLNWLQVIIFVVSLSILISLPLLMTYVGTAVAVTYVKSREFPFLLLTNIPANEIVEGYLYATIYRCRALITLVISLSFALSITMKSGGIQFTLYPATLGLGTVESMMKHIFMGFLIAVTICALCLLGTSAGILLGLWCRQIIIANSVATIFLFVAAFWWLDKSGQILTQNGIYSQSNPYGYDVLHTLLYIPLPLLWSWLLLILARHWARKPQFRP